MKEIESVSRARRCGRREGSVRRVARRGWRRLTWMVAMAAATAPLAGCATKRDLKDLRAEVVALQARQDSLVRELAGQNTALMDTMRTLNELMYRVRGELGNQLLQLEQHILTVQELTGQSQRRIAELRAEWEARSQTFASAPAAGEEPGVVVASHGEAEELYTAGVEQLQRGNATTARRAFEQILREHPTHERAPDAQFQIAESYVVERNYDQALKEFDKVVQMFPNSARAPAALYRAGVIHEERGNNTAARQYFERVASGWPRSDEARLAAEKLRTLRR